MTSENFTIKSHSDHTRFGGLIYTSDFETDYTPNTTRTGGSHIAERIVSDWKFDRACSMNVKTREFRKEYKKCRN